MAYAAVPSCTPTAGAIRSVTVNGVKQEVNVPVKAGDTISFSKGNEVVVKPREFKVGDRVTIEAMVIGHSSEKSWPLRLKLPSGVETNQAPESLTPTA